MSKVSPIVKEKHASGLEVRRRGDQAYISLNKKTAMRLEDYEKMMGKKQEKKTRR